MNSAQAGSYILSYVTLALIILYTVWISKTTQNFLNSKNNSEKDVFMEKYGVLFEIFEEKKFLQSGFFMFICIKRILFALILVVLNYYIATSQLHFIMLEISLIFMLVKSKPYKEKIFYYRDLLVEITYVIIHLTSKAIYQEFAEKPVLGSIFVYCCWIILGSYTLCLFYETIKIVKYPFRKRNS
jgi:hypothetical protein